MKNKSYLALLAIPLAGLGIAGSVAFAQTNIPAPVQAQTQEIQAGLPDGKEEMDREIPDVQEQQMLQAKATITADQAKQVAQTKLGGTATSVELEDENGTVVYNVIIGNREVKVNATDGSIVKIEVADAENESDDSTQMTTGHGNEPNDGASASGGDGETNDDAIIR
ncbi:MAG: PepSY domain-containing protein [Minisyncoccota bacterium]